MFFFTSQAVDLGISEPSKAVKQIIWAFFTGFLQGSAEKVLSNITQMVICHGSPSKNSPSTNQGVNKNDTKPKQEPLFLGVVSLNTTINFGIKFDSPKMRTVYD